MGADKYARKAPSSRDFVDAFCLKCKAESRQRAVAWASGCPSCSCGGKIYLKNQASLVTCVGETPIREYLGSPDPQSVKLCETDPRVQRIAAALGEGCNGRDYASSDAQILAKFYADYLHSSNCSFTEARSYAFARFLVEVLAGQL